MIMNKICRVCDIDKPLDDFAIQPKNKDGRDSCCKVCQRDYDKAYYQKNRVKRRAQNHKHYIENKDKYADKQKKYMQADYKKFRAIQSRSHQKYRLERQAKHCAWLKTDKGRAYSRHQYQRRRVLMAQVEHED